MDSLTKDSATLLSVMYKHYLSQRKSGISKSDANYFENSSFIQENLISKWSFDDVDDTLRELSRSGLVSCCWYDDSAHDIILTDSVICKFEHRFKNGLSDLIDLTKVVEAVVKLFLIAT